MRWIFLVILTVGFASHSEANQLTVSGLDHAKPIDKLGIFFNDHATGECWTNAETVRKRLMVRFAQSKIEFVSREGLSPQWVELQVTGLRENATKACVGHIRFTVTQKIGELRDRPVYADIYVNGTLGIFQNNLNKMILSDVDEWFDDFYLEASKNKLLPK